MLLLQAQKNNTKRGFDTFKDSWKNTPLHLTILVRPHGCPSPWYFLQPTYSNYPPSTPTVQSVTTCLMLDNSIWKRVTPPQEAGFSPPKSCHARREAMYAPKGRFPRRVPPDSLSISPPVQKYHFTHREENNRCNIFRIFRHVALPLLRQTMFRELKAGFEWRERGNPFESRSTNNSEFVGF